MKAKRRQIEAMKRKIQYGHGRSSLFVWMIDHHADLMTKDRSGRMPWTDLCADFVELGLRDGEGKLPTPKRAGATWRAVCAEIEAQAKRAESEQRSAPPVHRSRESWTPPITGAPAPAPASAPTHRTLPEPSQLEDRPAPRRPEAAPSAPTASSTTGSSPLDDLPPEAKAKIDRLRQAFAETDRKRFGRY
jgi:hypothetical protein